MFQYFPAWVKSYALQTGRNCSQWCIFQDFVQSGVKCQCNLYFFLISLRKLSLLCIPHGIFLSQHSTHIFLSSLTSFYFSNIHFYYLRTLTLASQSKISPFSNSRNFKEVRRIELESSQCMDSVQWAVRKECGVTNKHRMYLYNQNSSHSCLPCGGHRVGWLPTEGFPWLVDFSDVKLFILHKCEVLSGIQTIWRWPEVTENQERILSLFLGWLCHHKASQVRGAVLHLTDPF